MGDFGGNLQKEAASKTKKLLQRLHLQDKIQQKFSPAEILQILPTMKQHHATSRKNLAHTFLRRLVIRAGYHH